MLTLGIAIALFSALTQAIAHAMLKAGDDKLLVRGLIGATGASVVLPLVPFVPWPTPALWPWLGLACALHVVYQLILVRAYAAADFSVAYPLARGAVPLLTAVAALALLQERLSALAIAGVLLVTAGMALVAGRSGLRAGAIISGALGAGAMTTLYTVVDGHAVRLAPQAATFIVWFFILDGAAMFPLALVARRGRGWTGLRAEWRHSVLAGIASLLTYGSALLALRLLPLGAAAALRETSVVAGVLLARFVLRERVDGRRAGGAVLVAAGGALVVLGVALTG